MATMQLTIRDDLRAWAEAEVREGRYGSPDELVNAALDRVHGEAQRKAALKAALDEGEASGVDPRPVKQFSPISDGSTAFRMHELELAKRAVTDLAEISRYSRSQFGALVASR